MAFVSVAGPAANFVLALLFASLFQLGIVTADDLPRALSVSPIEWITLIAFFSVQMNLILGVFNLLPIPPLDTLLDYLEAAHARTLELVSALTAERLDASPDPETPGRTFGSSLRHLISHKNNHHGQIDYIRGLQDEVWDLPAGTGMNLR